MNLVNAQQTRRMLDRMVGYRISPLFVGKGQEGLLVRSRVQSVALRMIATARTKSMHLSLRNTGIEADLPEREQAFGGKVLWEQDSRVRLLSATRRN